ncbi:hypothetical protein DTL42_09230 [Bremerella cremea]|uniref:Uncharacterized protein n=1 Tax=Bremerella cremea TaxID=1031537 RepID=A0A368KTL4_9BACT|nr:hypothetical protein [Bremerella cremea]RCS52985.1 hypothetical protein DTL42_09230 [Bremerella cremea]
MPLSFRCETCRRSIRVPDGSEGKLTRCPDCFSILLVPFQSPSQPGFKDNKPTELEESEDPLGIAGKYESRWEPDYSPSTSTETAAANHYSPPGANPAPNSTPSNNPFADHKEPLYSSEAVASNDQSFDELDNIDHVSAARSCRTVATIAGGLMVICGLMTALIFLGVLANLLKMTFGMSQDLETILKLAGELAMSFAHVATIVFLNNARTTRNFNLARLGFIMAMIPIFNLTWCVVFPLPIWGLIVLHRPEVRWTFENHWERVTE